MDGIQKTIYDGLRYLANNVQEGRYGKDDDFADEENQEAFLEDLQDHVIGKMD